MARSIQVLLTSTLWLAPALSVCAQQSYSNYYQNQINKFHTPPATSTGGAGRYTYDTYFANNPNISPYTALLIPNNTYLPNYQAYVLPEQKMRAATAPVGPSQMRGPNSNLTPYTGRPNTGGGAGASTGAVAGRSDGFYQNHWYGGWQNRR